MLSAGPAKKVTIHLNEDTSSRHDFLFNEILTFLYRQGVAGATLLRPQAGFGGHHRMHNASAEGIAGEHLPIRIEFIESLANTDAILPDLLALVTDGLVEVQDTTILRAVTQG